MYAEHMQPQRPSPKAKTNNGTNGHVSPNDQIKAQLSPKKKHHSEPSIHKS